jgi:hypothetical protein
MARVAYSDKNKAIGWIAPYIRGTQPTDNEIIKKLFEIYQKTGRIVVDGFVKANFIKMLSGEVVCIDVGFALKLENRMDRQQSRESLDFWDRDGMSRIYASLFSDHEKRFTRLVPVIRATKALLYLQMHRPDVRYVAHLYLNKPLIEQLVEGYNENNKPIHPNLTQIISDLDLQLLPYLSEQPVVLTSDDDDIPFVSSPESSNSNNSLLNSDLQSGAASVALPSGSESTASIDRFTLGLFAEHWARNKKPKSWLDLLAANTTAAWCDKLC